MFHFRRLSLWLALLGLAAAVHVVRRTTAVPPMPEPPVPPAQKPFVRGIGATGIVEALRENTAVAVPVAGIVAAVHVSPWSRVERGAPLLQLDDRELRAQLRMRELELGVQEAQLASERRQQARVEVLRASEAVSAEEADARLDALAIQEARVAAGRAGVEQTRTALERLTVRSPIAGTVLQVGTRVGEHVAPGATAPILLGAIDEVQVRADIDEQLAPRVVPGSRAVGYVKGDALRPISLEFVRIEPYVVPKRSLTGLSAERVDTRVLQVIYSFPNVPDRRIYVGQQMDLFIEGREGSAR